VSSYKLPISYYLTGSGLKHLATSFSFLKIITQKQKQERKKEKEQKEI
jgi:hypothetical protein